MSRAEKKSKSNERRQILMGFAGVGALTCFGLGGLIHSLRSTNRNKTDLDRRSSLIDDLLAADKDSCLSVAGAPLAAGLPALRVLEAAFLMPIWSAGDESDVHAMAAVPAVQRLIAGSNDPERLVPVLWAVAEAHAWSGKARSLAAEGRDAEAPKVEALMLDCARPRADPHVAIWAAQASRMLESLPDHRTMILRCVRRYAANHTPLPQRTTRLRIDPSDTTPAAAIVDAIRNDADLGAISKSALFEALALLSVETRLTDSSESGLGVHQTTFLDALWRMHELGIDVAATALESVTALFRKHGARLAHPAARLSATTGDPFALAVDDPVAGYRAALSALTRDEAAFMNELRNLVMTRGKNAHDFKYWDAVVAIGDRLSGDIRTMWLASSVASNVVRSDARWERHDEALALLRPRKP